MAEERSFEVVDRRRIRTGETPAADEAAGEAETPEEEPAAAGSAGTAFSAEEMLREMAQFSPLLLSVREVLKETAELLTEKAWIAMGLRPNPATGEVQADLPEAKRAIDAVKDMVRHLDPDASPEERRDLQSRMMDLNLNYVRQAQQGQ